MLGLPFFRQNWDTSTSAVGNSNLDRSASLVFDTVNRVVGVEPLLSGTPGS